MLVFSVPPCIDQSIANWSVVIRDGTGATKSQIVRTPLGVFYDCVGKPDWIVFSLKSPIGGRAKIFK